MKTLDNLKSLGYVVKINEGNIKLAYKGEGLPDKSRVLPLLQELKANKSEIIKELESDKPISDEELQDLFLETMDKINDGYLAGTIKYIQDHHKDLDAEIDKADGRINEVWQKCNDGEVSIENFKDTLASYENLYLKAIGLYRSNTERVGKSICQRCGKPGERYCYGEVKPGKYNWGRFCLACYPHHF